MQRRRERCAGVKRAVRGKGREGKGSERRGMEGGGIQLYRDKRPPIVTKLNIKAKN